MIIRPDAKYTKPRQYRRVTILRRAARYLVYVFRDVTDIAAGADEGRTQDGAVETADSTRIATDALVVYRALQGARAGGLLPGGIGTEISIEEALPIQASGGIGGMAVTVNVTLS